MKTLHRFTSICLFLILVCCSSQNNNKSEEILPPIELIESNIELSELVCTAKILNFAIEDTIFSDSGKPGYLIHTIEAQVIKSYKGNLKIDEVFSYRNFIEYSEKKFHYSKVLIFLNKEKSTGEYHVIEVGQFEATAGMINLVDQLFK